MKKQVLFILGALAMNGLAQSQETDTTKIRPGQVTVFYPMGTNGFDAPKYSNKVSVNLFSGINGGLHGVEFGGILNTNLGDVNGVQFAGIANVNTKKTNGLVFSGICNIMKDSSMSISSAGIANIMGGPASGFHSAGIVNIVNGNFTGGQFGGIVNLVNGNAIGAQFGGITNTINGNLIGAQFAGISNLINGDLIGAQFGLINAAKKITGFQIGLINFAESYENGVPLGLFSFVKNGFHALEISGGESIYGNVSFKLGVDNLYTIYKVGFAANGEDNYMTYGMGLGSMIAIGEKSKISMDLSANHIVKPNSILKFDLLSRADFAYRYHFNKHLTVFGGPSFNVYLSEHDIDNGKTALHVPYTLYEENWGNKQGSTSLWVGANLGVSILF